MPSVLFVCTGNLCRSPMAQVLFADWLKRNAVPGEWRVASAGTGAADGAPAAAYACEVVAERGLDLSRHRARRVTESLLAEQDLVLCMTRAHGDVLQAAFPAYAHRVYLLTEMAGQRYDVPDPYGGPRVEYAEAADELAGLIERGGPQIVKLASGAR